MTNDTKKLLSEFLRRLADSLNIPESRYKQAEERYQAVGKWLGREDSIVAALSPKIYPQGSIRLGTIIKPVADEEEYDIDLVCEMRLSKTEVSQKRLKNMVGTELKKYVQANNMKSNPKEGRRCWTLSYADEAQFHMDILPAIPDSKSFNLLLESKGFKNGWSNDAIAITDNTLPSYELISTEWLPSNPKGYAEWFKDRMKVRLETQRKFFAESTRTKIEDVPDYKIKTPLQQTIQILKRHRDIMFAEDQEDKPISIIITTLAAHAYNNEADLLDAMLNIITNMSKHITIQDNVSWVPNPVNPMENFADKWREHPQREQKFKQWLQQVHSDLENALRKGDIGAISEFLKPSFGEKAISETMKRFPENNVHSKTLVVADNSRKLSGFNVPHRQKPNWPITQQGYAAITGWANRDGFRPSQIKSDTTLPKHYSLRFEVNTNVPWPYKVYWQVVNTGEEAQRANCLRGEFYEGILAKGGRVREESTLYTGMHWIECFIVKDNICLARSGEFIVNIE